MNVAWLEYPGVVLALLGNLWVVRKRREGFACWIASNGLLIPVVVVKGLFGIATLHCCFLALAAYGWWQWGKHE